MKKLTALLLAALFVAIPLAPATVEAVDVNRFLCLGINLGDGDKCPSTDEDDPNNPENAVSDLANDIVNVLTFVVGVVSVIMIIIGGLRYITSAGDSGNITNAKNTILYAIVGLVIVIVAQVIVNLVVSQLTQE